MDLKPNKKLLVQKKNFINPKSVNKPPFWIPATGYYVLSVSVTGIVFFTLIGIWGHEDTPLMISGIIASSLLGGAVILREVVLKQRRRAIIQAQKKIDDNSAGLTRRDAHNAEIPLTLERNAQLVGELKSKSSAAATFENLPEAHREVFELCESYLQRNLLEINRTGIASSKLQTLTADRRLARTLHKHHLLKWAVTDSAAMLNKAKSLKSFARKIEYAKKSLGLIETALEFYPNEIKLKDSSEFIRDFILDEKLKKMIGRAEKQFLASQPLKTIQDYQKILKVLEKEDRLNSERESLAAEIKLRIERIEATTK